MILLENVTKDYSLGNVVVPALRNVSLSVEAGEFLAIVGPSGSGKTTLLNLIGCIEKPDSGNIKINGMDVTHLSLNRLSEIRAGCIGYIFQTFNLLPVLTVAENVEYPLYMKKLTSQERRERVQNMLKAVGLEKFARHKPGELSGGQRQRAAIARALAASPALVLADEPTANLDQLTGLEVIKLMHELNERFDTTFIFSTHDPKIMTQAARVIELRDGSLTGNKSCY